MITLQVVIFKLAHGQPCENMVNHFNNIGMSTIRKYMKIIILVHLCTMYFLNIFIIHLMGAIA
jgi:hypothetical protein